MLCPAICDEPEQIHSYQVIIKETNLDLFGHVNNADYLVLFEEARWDMITRNGYGVSTIRETGLGPVVLEVSLLYRKELKLRDEIVIKTSTISYEKKIGVMHQKMVRAGESCCDAQFKFALFDLESRKLVLPTPRWLKGIGLSP